MKLVLATSNKGKVREIKHIYSDMDVVAYSDIIEPFEIEENALTFKENALIKARAVFEALHDKDVIVIADDSGISVDALGGEPGIYSARYAGADASDKDNLYKLVDALKEKGLTTSKAHYTAAIAIVTKDVEFTVHGWMYGDVITAPRGENGFGYDPIFIPQGYEKTLGELDEETKKGLSHRSQALKHTKSVLKTISKHTI
ncbi:RdgB/HAM1 family non-canonical purine NTP pyrophosphatase [bacterium]|nr:RdgB/HAM1 family non-canonical purine NTP pyrophosphatase [bacterium]MBU1883961.1 RdgB/HAM1 family non-canonical purine NTP pyrophosphatase [bacterium]